MVGSRTIHAFGIRNQGLLKHVSKDEERYFSILFVDCAWGKKTMSKTVYSSGDK